MKRSMYALKIVCTVKVSVECENSGLNSNCVCIRHLYSYHGFVLSIKSMYLLKFVCMVKISVECELEKDSCDHQELVTGYDR
jgi:hypothetical protein